MHLVTKLASHLSTWSSDIFVCETEDILHMYTNTWHSYVCMILELHVTYSYHISYHIFNLSSRKLWLGQSNGVMHVSRITQQKNIYVLDSFPYQSEVGSEIDCYQEKRSTKLYAEISKII